MRFGLGYNQRITTSASVDTHNRKSGFAEFRTLTILLHGVVIIPVFLPFFVKLCPIVIANLRLGQVVSKSFAVPASCPRRIEAVSASGVLALILFGVGHRPWRSNICLISGHALEVIQNYRRALRVSQKKSRETPPFSFGPEGVFRTQVYTVGQSLTWSSRAHKNGVQDPTGVGHLDA
jgi:hypothetical protein